MPLAHGTVPQGASPLRASSGLLGCRTAETSSVGGVLLVAPAGALRGAVMGPPSRRRGRALWLSTVRVPVEARDRAPGRGRGGEFLCPYAL